MPRNEMVAQDNELVSVVMPVFNSEDFLAEAIESILNQTYQNFELIVVNDGSTDRSDSIVREFKDDRIVYITNDKNKGIVATINEGISFSKGKYIARMDADDIAHPSRLAKQVHFLKTHPDFKLCGTTAIAINEAGEAVTKWKRPAGNDKIKVFNLFRNAFIHPTIMADADLLRRIGFSEEYKYAEDYYTFSQFAMNYKVANLQEPLLRYRLHTQSITAKKNKEMVESELKTMAYLLSFLFDSVSLEMTKIHHQILRPSEHPANADSMHLHLLQIYKANEIRKIFNHQLLVKQLQKEWYNYLYRNKTPKALIRYLSSPFVILRNFAPKHFIKLIFS